MVADAAERVWAGCCLGSMSIEEAGKQVSKEARKQRSKSVSESVSKYVSKH